MKKECVVCGAGFDARRSAKTCSRECSRVKIAEKNRKYRQENREAIAEKSRKYRQENPEKIAEHHHKYRQENREKLAEKQRKRCQENLPNYTKAYHFVRAMEKQTGEKLL